MDRPQWVRNLLPMEHTGHPPLDDVAWPAAVILLAVAADDKLVAVMGLDIVEGRIRSIHAIANPDELRHLDRAGHLEGLLYERPGTGGD